MTMAAASPVGILRSPAALRPCVAPRRPAASCSFRIRAAPAHLRAMSRQAPRPSSRVAPRRLRCAPSGEIACVVAQNEEYVEPKPRCAPSGESPCVAQDEEYVEPRPDCAPGGDIACVAQEEENVVPSGESACVAQDEEYVVVPPWVPSEEEVDEFRALDMSWAAIDERFRRESAEARAAVVGAVVGVLRPLWDNFRDLRRLKYLHETEEFQIGMPFGALMTCIGLYHLWKVAPNLCLDVAMPYAFYKLSVLAADVRRRGFSPDLIIRIKLALAVAMFMKDIHLKCTPLDFYVRVPVYFMYTLSVLWDLSGKKKVAKYALATIFYEVTCFFQNSKSMLEPGAKLVAAEEVDGGLVQCVPETDSRRLCGSNEGGETPQILHEPDMVIELADNSRLCGAKEGGETLQFLHEPDIVIELVDNSRLCGAKEGGETLQFLNEPDTAVEVDNSRLCGAKEGGETLQFLPEPDIAVEVDNSRLCGAKEGGETLQFLHEPDIAVEVDNSSSVKEDGKLPHFTSKCHHTTEEENGDLQFVSEPGDASNLKEESEVPHQFVAEPDQ